MKKLLLLLFLIPVFAAAQKTTGGNYTYIAQRYEWLTGLFQALNIPAGDSAQHKSGQDMRAGALYYDTLGIDAGLKIWNGLAWVDIGAGGFFSPDQTSTGNTSHDAGGFNFALNNVGDLGLNSENTNLIANSDLTISGDSVRMNSTSGRITFPNLVADDDTTTFKPMGRDAATGRLRQLSSWHGGNTYTASQGITLSGNDFQLGGTVTSTKTITNRNGGFIINPNKNAATPWFFTALDTVFNPDHTDSIPTVSFAQERRMRFPSYTSTDYRGNAQFALWLELKDSARVNSVGGDFMYTDQSIMYLTKMSGYSGRTALHFGNLSRADGVPIKLNKVDFVGTHTVANNVYARGYLVANQSYPITRANDTLSNWIGHGNWGFVPSGYIAWAADFEGGYLGLQSSARVGKHWFLYNQGTNSNSWLKTALYIGDSTLDASTLLNVSSTTKGVVFPRMTGAQQNAIASPITGLMIYNTDSLAYCFYNGTSWNKMGTGSGGGGGGGTWGSITGTLSSQTDLQAELDGKANTALSNLASVAVNTSLVSDADNTDDLGSTSLMWKDAWAYTFKAGNGSISSPSLSFKNSTNTGLYYTSADGGSIWFALGGVTMGRLGIQPGTSTINQGNTFLGWNAGAANGTGAVGAQALNNTFIGGISGQSNTTGNQNTAVGSRSLVLNTTGSQNTAVGQGAFYNAVTGTNNAGFGFHAGLEVLGSYNTFIGTAAGQGAVGATAQQNVAVGNFSQNTISTGSMNVSAGRYALGSITTSSNNTAIGHNAGFGITTGSGGNSLYGYQAGYDLTSGTYNVLIGTAIQAPSASTAGQLNIGNVLYGTGLYQSTTRSSTPTTLGSLGIGLTTPTARLMLPAGTATANTSPLKFTSGTNLTTPENGSVEYDGTHLYVTIAGVRHQLDQQSGGGVTTMGAIGSTPNANGATITGSTLNLEPASATFGGIVTTGTQSFAGTKSFGLISVSGISTSGYYGATETGSISTPGSGIGFFWAKTDGTPNYTNDDGLAVTLVGKKTNSEASTATPTPTGDAFQNIYNLTALATNATFAAPSGTPVDGNIIWMTIKDDGTSRTLGWNAIYDEGSDVALPTATVVGEEMELQLRYRSSTSKWRIIGKTGGF